MAAHFILFVSDASRSAQFYRAALQMEPRLEVPGMTEFELGPGCVLGLMPEPGIQRLLPDLNVGSGARSELYLHVPDPESAVRRAVEAGARLRSEVSLRNWGERVGYVTDPDGHVLAFAQA